MLQSALFKINDSNLIFCVFSLFPSHIFIVRELFFLSYCINFFGPISSIYFVQLHVNQLFFPEQSDAGDTESEFEYPAGSEFEIYIPYNVRPLPFGSVVVI